MGEGGWGSGRANERRTVPLLWVLLIKINRTQTALVTYLPARRLLASSRALSFVHPAELCSHLGASACACVQTKI